MQFKRVQREQLLEVWGAGSWFYANLGPAARVIIECAYGIVDIPQITPRERAKAQDDVTLAMSIFARRIGCDKSHVVHALLSGSFDGLQRALERNGNASSEQVIRDAWQSAFRDTNLGIT